MTLFSEKAYKVSLNIMTLFTIFFIFFYSVTKMRLYYKTYSTRVPQQAPVINNESFFTLLLVVLSQITWRQCVPSASVRHCEDEWKRFSLGQLNGTQFMGLTFLFLSRQFQLQPHHRGLPVNTIHLSHPCFLASLPPSLFTLGARGVSVRRFCGEWWVGVKCVCSVFDTRMCAVVGYHVGPRREAYLSWAALPLSRSPFTGN